MGVGGNRFNCPFAHMVKIRAGDILLTVDAHQAVLGARPVHAWRRWALITSGFFNGMPAAWLFNLDLMKAC